MNYYNENNEELKPWLQHLIDENFIALGEIDTRSIEDVTPKDLDGFTQCHFFTGIGGWPYALRQSGISDKQQWWSGSCPCQPFSTAGQGKGFRDNRHLWPAFKHLIRVKQPQLVVGEQVAKKAGKLWMDFVAHDLEACGYRVGAVILSASCYGANHKRERFYFVADATGQRRFRYVNEWRLSLLSHQSTQLDFLNSALVDGWRPLEPRPESIPHDDGVSPSLARLLLHGYGNAIHIPSAVSFLTSYMEEVVNERVNS